MQIVLIYCKYLCEIVVLFKWAYVLQSVYYKSQNARLQNSVLMNNQAS